MVLWNVDSRKSSGAAYADKVRHVLSLLSARGIALIADVGPRTCDLLGLERIEDLRDLGLEYLRLDYGFSAQRVAELSGVFRIVVNASTVSSDEIASWREAGADVTRFAACHKFLPQALYRFSSGGHCSGESSSCGAWIRNHGFCAG